MLMDGYVPEVRVRVMSLHQAGVVTGAVMAPVIAGVLSAWAGLSWRGIFIIVGLGSLVIAALGTRLTEPRLGRHDTDKVRAAVRAELGSTGTGDAEGHDLRFVETLRRLWLIPTVRRLLAAWAVLGVATAALPIFMSFYLAEEWRMGLGPRSAFLAAAWAFALPALAWFGPRGDAWFAADPAKLVTAASVLLGALAAGLATAVVVPTLPAVALGFGVALAATAALIPALTVTTLSVVAPKARPAAGALVATFLVGVGGQGGAMLLGGLDRRFGAGGAVGLLVLPALAAALVVRRAVTTVNRDVEQMLSQVVEEEEVRAIRQRGARLPMLACRHIDFSYGQLQVLFDVNFTVDDGEMVALLGTNGAGKSTLLRVISGLGFPSRGTVRLRGGDITYIEAERRVEQGISQVPGGRAVFAPLTVVENLRLLGYTHGNNRRAVDSGIDASFDAFPRLGERRNQLASTLSGGEQQMLGLATAFIMRPQLLLIDELSLGLAPKVIGQLLEMVRGINAAGTAVVLVEQSVNIALSLVEHAYFMEKGEIRFDGASGDLLARPDLLRSVFLQGATHALSDLTR
jgi:ABC-type branched-subunit amino acid transport system ATPase component